MSTKHKPGALDEFLERQDLAQNPANNVGNFRTSAPVYMLGRVPLVRILLGLSIGIPAIAGLILQFVNPGGNWFDLIYVVPIIALSVLLIVSGISNLLAKKGKHKTKEKKAKIRV